MIVKAATTNQVKIEGIRTAFQRYFHENIDVIPVKVDSGVSRQPINDDVFKGAKNRLEALKKVEEDDWDYVVSCEGGMICQYGCWFNLQVIVIERKDGKVGHGLSQGFEIPSEYVQEAINTSIAKVMDKLFEGKGGISFLTRGRFNRKKLVEDGTIMALARMLNGDIW